MRVARTAHGLGLSTVGVVTEADAGALHADATDMVVSIGSYLDADELLRAARVARRAVGAPGLRVPERERGVRARGRATPGWCGSARRRRRSS